MSAAAAAEFSLRSKRTDDPGCMTYEQFWKAITTAARASSREIPPPHEGSRCPSLPTTTPPQPAASSSPSFSSSLAPTCLTEAGTYKMNLALTPSPKGKSLLGQQHQPDRSHGRRSQDGTEPLDSYHAGAAGRPFHVQASASHAFSQRDENSVGAWATDRTTTTLQSRDPPQSPGIPWNEPAAQDGGHASLRLAMASVDEHLVESPPSECIAHDFPCDLECAEGLPGRATTHMYDCDPLVLQAAQSYEEWRSCLLDGRISSRSNYGGGSSEEGFATVLPTSNNPDPREVVGMGEAGQAQDFESVCRGGVSARRGSTTATGTSSSSLQAQQQKSAPPAYLTTSPTPSRRSYPEKLAHRMNDAAITLSGCAFYSEDTPGLTSSRKGYGDDTADRIAVSEAFLLRKVSMDTSAVCSSLDQASPQPSRALSFPGSRTLLSTSPPVRLPIPLSSSVCDTVQELREVKIGRREEGTASEAKASKSSLSFSRLAGEVQRCRSSPARIRSRQDAAPVSAAVPGSEDVHSNELRHPREEDSVGPNPEDDAARAVCSAVHRRLFPEFDISELTDATEQRRFDRGGGITVLAAAPNRTTPRHDAAIWNEKGAAMMAVGRDGLPRTAMAHEEAAPRLSRISSVKRSEVFDEPVETIIELSSGDISMMSDAMDSGHLERDVADAGEVSFDNTPVPHSVEGRSPRSSRARTIVDPPSPLCNAEPPPPHSTPSERHERDALAATVHEDIRISTLEDDEHSTTVDCVSPTSAVERKPSSLPEGPACEAHGCETPSITEKHLTRGAVARPVWPLPPEKQPLWCKHHAAVEALYAPRLLAEEQANEELQLFLCWAQERAEQRLNRFTPKIAAANHPWRRNGGDAEVMEAPALPSSKVKEGREADNQNGEKGKIPSAAVVGAWEMAYACQRYRPSLGPVACACSSSSSLKGTQAGGEPSGWNAASRPVCRPAVYVASPVLSSSLCASHEEARVQSPRVAASPLAAVMEDETEAHLHPSSTPSRFVQWISCEVDLYEGLLFSPSGPAPYQQEGKGRE